MTVLSSDKLSSGFISYLRNRSRVGATPPVNNISGVSAVTYSSVTLTYAEKFPEYSSESYDIIGGGDYSPKGIVTVLYTDAVGSDPAVHAYDLKILEDVVLLDTDASTVGVTLDLPPVSDIPTGTTFYIRYIKGSQIVSIRPSGSDTLEVGGVAYTFASPLSFSTIGDEVRILYTGSADTDSWIEII